MRRGEPTDTSENLKRDQLVQGSTLPNEGRAGLGSLAPELTASAQEPGDDLVSLLFALRRQPASPLARAVRASARGAGIASPRTGARLGEGAGN